MNDLLKNFLAICLILCGIMIFFFIFFSISEFGRFLFEKNIQCPNLARSLNMEYKYNFWAGGICFVKLENGQWINAEQYKGIKIDD